LNPDIETYSHYICEQIAGIQACLRGLSDEQINEAPAVEDANSAFVIATHVLGNARAWVLGIACGQPLRRDRPAEFASRGSFEAFDSAATALCAEIEAALLDLDPSALDRRFRPSQELWGAGEVQEVTVRSALAHVLQHASMHLGQIQLTRDLVVAG